MRHLARALLVVAAVLGLVAGCERYRQQGRWNPADPDYDGATDPNNDPDLAPVAPTALEADASTVGSIILTWQDNSDYEEGFTIQRKLAAEETFEDLPGTATEATCTDTDIEPATEYAYRVAAFNSVDWSDWCTPVLITSAGAWEINVQQDGTDIAGDGTGEYAFAATGVSAYADATFTIQNLGSVDLELTGTEPVTLAGTDAAEFEVTSQPGSPVAGGDDTSVTIRFAPQSGGDKTATVSIASNDEDEGEYTFSISGSASLGDVRITVATGASTTPSLAWSGTEFGVVWNDDRDGDDDLYFARMSAGGIKQGDDVRVTNAATAISGYSLAWAGTEYGVAWATSGSYTEDLFTRISSGGVKQGGDVMFSSTPENEYDSYPSLVWAGSQYGVAWFSDESVATVFARLDAAGTVQGGPVSIASPTSPRPSLAWSGPEFGFGIAWKDNRANYKLYFARVSYDGLKQGGDVLVSDLEGAHPSLVWTGTEYGVVWQQYPDKIYFAGMSATGVKPGSDVLVTDSSSVADYPSLAWTGSEYGVAWEDSRNGSLEIYLARLGSDGVKQGSDMRITNATGASKNASLVWADGQFGLAWQDERDGNYEIYFTILDGDGTKQ